LNSSQDNETTTGRVKNVGIGWLAINIAVMAGAFAVALFLPAGTFAWPAGWAFFGLFFGFTVALSIWLFRFSPELLAERLTGIGKADQKAWDKVLLAITAVAFFAWLAVMGIDAVRYRWSHVPAVVRTLGGCLLVASFPIFFSTFRENRFLSPAVRIQQERAHRVVDTGPYRRVRHPMYGGFVLFALGTALMLGSWYGTIGALCLIGLVARRAVLEERALQRELEGYDAYMRRVRYRLVPHVW
jgi:protein-S-isoprenylcysteine O-methyltransferase Ste14